MNVQTGEVYYNEKDMLEAVKRGEKVIPLNSEPLDPTQEAELARLDQTIKNLARKAAHPSGYSPVDIGK